MRSKKTLLQKVIDCVNFGFVLDPSVRCTNGNYYVTNTSKFNVYKSKLNDRENEDCN